MVFHGWFLYYSDIYCWALGSLVEVAFSLGMVIGSAVHWNTYTLQAGVPHSLSRHIMVQMGVLYHHNSDKIRMASRDCGERFGEEINCKSIQTGSYPADSFIL